ncbi:hypothetical protein AAVH_28720, partial [Aphelenchoides avenae]
IYYLAYSDPCSLIRPAWFIVVVRMWNYIYMISFPLHHIAVSFERIWATTRPSEYEKTGRAYGITCCIIVWMLTLGYVAYLVQGAFQHEAFQYGSPVITLTTNTNVGMVQTASTVIVCLALVSLAMDGVIGVINRRYIGRVSPGYNLGRNYQISENVIVTLRLMLPLDVVNAVLYIACMGSTLLFRPLRGTMDAGNYQALIELSTL